MARRRGQRKGYLRPENGNWLFTYRVYTREHPKGHRLTVTIGPSDGTGKLTKKQAERFAYEHYLQPLDTSVVKPLSTMTVGEFWDKKYEPNLRKSKKYATQSQYISIWKTWLQPVCGKVRMFEWTPDHVDASINNVLAAGKSSATAKHVRKVASAIFSFAKRMQCASGDNPAQAIESISVEPVRQVRSLTWEQAQSLLGQLPEPARTMALMSITMSMNVSEMLGLREKHLNMTDQVVIFDGGDAIPPHEIAVREHMYHGRRGSLKTGSRKRNIPMPEFVEQALLLLVRSNKDRHEDAPIFQTKSGTPQSADNLAKRVLKPAAEACGLPWLGWHTLRHTHATFTKMAGMSDYDRQRVMGHSSADMLRRYTHDDDQARVRVGLNRIAERLLAIDGGKGAVN